jgi:hypothetical protein
LNLNEQRSEPQISHSGKFWGAVMLSVKKTDFRELTTVSGKTNNAITTEMANVT